MLSPRLMGVVVPWVKETELRSLRSLPSFSRVELPRGRGRVQRPEAGLPEQLRVMLPLWLAVVAVSALATPAPGAGGQRRGAVKAWADAPNVVLVVSDSFVSMERQGRGRPATHPRPAHSPSCAAGFGEQNLRLSNVFYPDAK